eukprot:g19588.t1
MPSDTVLSFYSCANAACGGMLQKQRLAGQKLAAKYRACAQCRLAYYCSVACQEADWKARHKVSCLAGAKNNAQHARALAFLQQVGTSQDLRNSLLAAADQAQRDRKICDVFLLATARPSCPGISISALSRADLAQPNLQHLRAEVKNIPPEVGVCVVVEALLERLPERGGLWKKSITPTIIGRAGAGGRVGGGDAPRKSPAPKGQGGRHLRAHSLATTSRTLDCACCSREDSAAAPLLACSRCRLVMYCNAACQRTHWQTLHKAHCRRKIQPALAAVLAMELPQRHLALKRAGASTVLLEGRLLLLEAVLDLVPLNPATATLPPQPVPRERLFFQLCADKARAAAERLSRGQAPDCLQAELQSCVPAFLQPQILSFWARCQD